jgi:acyl carrier protein phosphodiesterase
MNYLAHLYLSDGTPDGLLGNLMADFIRGGSLAPYSPAIQAGVRLHRRVDAYTDTHPIVLQCKRLVAAPFGRYAGVITDMAWDHFLACNWSRYAEMDLDDFAGQVYALLEERRETLPERLFHVAPRMIAGRWLQSYASLDGVCAVFPRLARRLKRENCLAEAGAVLRRHRDEWEPAFHQFFPEAIAYARSELLRRSQTLTITDSHSVDLSAPGVTPS